MSDGDSECASDGVTFKLTVVEVMDICALIVPPSYFDTLPSVASR